LSSARSWIASPRLTILLDRRKARGDVVVIDWATGAALHHDGDVIPFPQPKRGRK
jgi:hypothetical protein